MPSCSENDSESQVQRAPGARERASEMEIRAGAGEQPRVLVAEAERPELIEAPAGNTTILEVDLFVLGMLLGGRGHRAPFREGDLLSYLL